MNTIKIGIIGVGNLGASIANGLLKKGYSSLDIMLSDPRKNVLDRYAQKGVNIAQNNHEVMRMADMVIVAVKPYKMADILTEIKDDVTANHIILSTVSGFSMQQMEEALQGAPPLFRVMPNTAISVNESVTCMSSKNASEEQKTIVQAVFEKLGMVIPIDEELMNASTVLGACGIAYGMRFLRAMTQGGIEIGFDAVTANKIAIQTLKGSCELLLQNGSHPEQEIDKVTTPKGCTIAGLNEMEHHGFSSSLIKGIITSFDKI